MKKVLAASLVGIGILGLAACSDTDETTTQSVSPSMEENQTEAPAATQENQTEAPATMESEKPAEGSETGTGNTDSTY